VSPLWAATATELGALYAAQATTPLAVLEAVLARIAAVNPGLNAIVTLDAAGARAAAEASTARWAAGEALGPLDGVPITVKDNLHVGGMRATWGSALYADYVAPEDDLPVARLRALGVVILGKTNTPELALSGYTDNRVFGATGNPWAPELTSGGSSGGDHSPVQPACGGENTRGINQDELRWRAHHHGADAKPGGLRLGRDNGHLGAGGGIDQGGFSRIRGADDGDEGAARFCHVRPFYGKAAGGEGFFVPGLRWRLGM
jgi:aspartyl-tRNA(Asn)/glutamyl-tRNA(Gln) amidotransferase subunit A